MLAHACTTIYICWWRERYWHKMLYPEFTDTTDELLICGLESEFTCKIRSGIWYCLRGSPYTEIGLMTPPKYWCWLICTNPGQIWLKQPVLMKLSLWKNRHEYLSRQASQEKDWRDKRKTAFPENVSKFWAIEAGLPSRILQTAYYCRRTRSGSPADTEDFSFEINPTYCEICGRKRKILTIHPAPATLRFLSPGRPVWAQM